MRDSKFKILKRNRPPYIQYIVVSLGVLVLLCVMLVTNLLNEVKTRNQLNAVYARMIEGTITRTLESVENSLFPLLIELNEEAPSAFDQGALEKRIKNLIFFAPHIRQLVVLKEGRAIFDSNHRSKGHVDLTKLNFPHSEISHYSIKLQIGDTINGRFLPIEEEPIDTNSNRRLIPIHLERQFLNKLGAYSILVALNASHLDRLFQRLDAANLDEYHLMRLDGQHMLADDKLMLDTMINSAMPELIARGQDEYSIEESEHGLPVRHSAIRLSPKYPLAVVISSNHFNTAAKWLDDNKQLILSLCVATLAILVTVFLLYLDYHRNRRLRKEVQLLSTAVHQSPVTILITDPKGVIQYANSAFETVYGYKEDDWKGQTPALLKGGQSNPSVYKDLWSNLNAGQSWQGEFLNRTKDNRLIPTTTAVSPVIDEDGQFTHIVGILADISTQKALQEKAQEATRLAKKANEAKSNFLATMSHELRTPMTGIRGIINLLRTQNISAEETKNFLKDLDQSSNALLLLLNDILDLSKIEAGKLQIEQLPCNPAETIQTILHLFKDNADNQNIALTTNAEKYQAIWVETDGLRLRQIISNLISNAIKFTREGQVDVHMNVTQQDDKKVRFDISVHDTGIGMNEQQVQKVFDPFTQADSTTTRKYGGTGLGLTITKQLCEMLGGKITVDSEIGKGTVFTISLCLPTTTAPNAEEEETAEFGSLKILLAEDNPINIKVIETTLKRKGHQVTCALNGKIAVSKAAQETFDLILMDMHMPEMDGMDATRIIRDSSPYNQATPIMALTADAFPEHHKKYKETGINDVITKPVKWDLFEKTVARYLK